MLGIGNETILMVINLPKKAELIDVSKNIILFQPELP